jgi:hypothetical protein
MYVLGMHLRKRKGLSNANTFQQCRRRRRRSQCAQKLHDHPRQQLAEDFVPGQQSITVNSRQDGRRRTHAATTTRQARDKKKKKKGKERKTKERKSKKKKKKKEG